MTPEEKAAAAHATAVAAGSINDTVEDVSAVIRGRVARGLAVLGPAGRLPMAAVDSTHSCVHQAIRVGAAGAGSLAARGLRHGADPAAAPLADSPVGLNSQAVLGAAFGDTLPAALAPQLSLHRPDSVAGFTSLAVFVHGLGGHEQQWGVDYALAVAANDMVPVFARYTTGRSIDDNADELAAALAETVRTWPQELSRIVLVGHSMGGLVATRAVQRAGADSEWVPLVTDVVTLGSPHQGAPLERVSNVALDTLIATSEVAAPIARLGHTRSRGVKDLGPGLAEPLPSTIAHTAVVAAVGTTTRTTVSTVLGDGIVPVSSAVGPAPGAAHVTVVEFTRAHHLSLLNHPGVTDLLADIASRGTVAEPATAD